MTVPRPPHQQPQQPSGLSLHDVYYMLFRHKGKIIFCSTLGFVGAALIYLLAPETYRSEAKLLVRYVTESAVVDPEITGRRTLTPNSMGNAILNTELHILTSQDVIGSAIDRIGVDALRSEPGRMKKLRDRLKHVFRKIRPGTEGSQQNDERLDRGMLAHSITTGLRVNNPRDTNVINIEYFASSPDLAQRTLRTIIESYLAKHYAIHRSVGAYDYLAQQVDQTRSRLTQTEEELRALRAKSGFSSAQEAETALASGKTELQQQIWKLEGELAGIIAQSEVMEQWIASGGSSPLRDVHPPEGSPQSTAPSAGQGRVGVLSALREKEAALLSVYTEDSQPVQDLRAQINRWSSRSTSSATTNDTPLDVESLLPREDSPFFAYSPPMDPSLINARASAASLQARINTLREHLKNMQNNVEEQNTALARIETLQRKKEIEEANYRYFSQSLEQAKIDASLDAEKAANISIVQPATYPVAAWRAPNFWRNIFAALAAGVFAGLGLAFFLEKVADQSIRQPAQVETTVSAPLLMTIPQRAFRNKTISLHQRRETVKLLPAVHGEDDDKHLPHGRKKRAKSWTLQSDLKPYFEALRDRVVSFEKGADTETPCLLGITGCLHKSGATTMAAGLALTLARNGDGRVLFVDLSEIDHGNRDSLLDDTENVRLADIFADHSGLTTIMQPNLFVLSAREATDEPQRIKPSPRLEDIIAQLTASEYDYIVVDMPPISETSPSLRIAPLLSGIILIIEAEKVSRATAQKARKLLSQAQAHVIGAILNRKKQYVPAWLDHGDD